MLEIGHGALGMGFLLILCVPLRVPLRYFAFDY